MCGWHILDHFHVNFSACQGPGVKLQLPCLQAAMADRSTRMENPAAMMYGEQPLSFSSIFWLLLNHLILELTLLCAAVDDLRFENFPLQPLQEGCVRVQIKATGICGGLWLLSFCGCCSTSIATSQALLLRQTVRACTAESKACLLVFHLIQRPAVLFHLLAVFLGVYLAWLSVCEQGYALWFSQS